MTKLEYFKQWAADHYPYTDSLDGEEVRGMFLFKEHKLQIAWRAFQYALTIRPTTTMENGTLNKAEFRKDDPTTIVDRLRGIYPNIDLPYPTSLVMQEAAREIERLRVGADRYQWLRENLHRLQSMRPLHAPKPEELDAAIDVATKDETPIP
jgi:hypothetical protein